MRRAAGRILLLWMLGTWAMTGWVLWQSPFAQPVIARGAAEARLAFDRAMALRVTPEWLLPRLEAAIAAGKTDDIGLYLDLATAHGIQVPPDLLTRARAVAAAEEGWLATGTDCALCAYDIGRCPSLTLIGACAIPVELSPLGDMNALRRAGVAWVAGDEVDLLDAGLGLVGLVATGAVLVTGGTSETAKLGATTIRLARRMGALTPALARSLGDLVTGLVAWDRLPKALARGEALDPLIDAARWEALVRAARDVGRLRENTSSAEALILLRYADSPDDLRNLARVSDVAGGETRRVMRVLGPDAFRLLDRLSHLAVAAIGLVTLVLTQIADLTFALLRAVLRLLARPPRRPRRRVVA